MVRDDIGECSLLRMAEGNSAEKTYCDMAMTWKEKDQRQEMASWPLAEEYLSQRWTLTRAVPAATFPVVAPDQFSPPTVNKTTQRKVCRGRRIVLRPNLSVVMAQSNTAKRLTQLNVSRTLGCMVG
mgnify:CR=1 FL=1|jgi:hypothetical protein